MMMNKYMGSDRMKAIKGKVGKGMKSAGHGIWNFTKRQAHKGASWAWASTKHGLKKAGEKAKHGIKHRMHRTRTRRK
jgi:hypothetical protein